MGETYADEVTADEATGGGPLTDERVKRAGVAVSLVFAAVVLGFIALVLLEYVDYDLLFAVVPRFVVAFVRVLAVVVVSSVLAVSAGLLVGLGRVSRTSLTHSIATAYVQFFRGTPLLFQLFIIYLGIPSLWPPGEFPINQNWTVVPGVLWIDWSFITAVVALTLNHAAYVGEAVKGGINAVPDGQMEAARSLGMSYVDSMREVVLPQAWRNALAAIGNDQVILVKDTSLLTVIAFPEILTVFREINSNQFDAWTPIVLVAVTYLAITLPLMRLVQHLETRGEWRGER
ncbi:amino acid ABC transporter permease [Halorussus salilacus]|uniref:amino acid ABC transporter permease n=1 Tax=Halorussus salilacus TaxID=2953750 RepID=UPI0020A06EB3|nr:amino acid ABC transporter permease [Halorussus salilacus]USZ67693.1 amino acid ABC transporter permease [Halorussus salilacus]